MPTADNRQKWDNDKLSAVNGAMKNFGRAIDGIKGDIIKFGAASICGVVAILLLIIIALSLGVIIPESVVISIGGVFVASLVISAILIYLTNGYSVDKALERHMLEITKILDQHHDLTVKILWSIFELGKKHDTTISGLHDSIAKSLSLLELPRGKVQIKKIDEFYAHWSQIQLAARSSLKIVNYVNIKYLSNDTTSIASAPISMRIRLSALDVKRIYFVDDDTEAENIINNVITNMGKGVYSSYINTVTLFDNGVISMEELPNGRWSQGFVIIDEATVAIFQMDDDRFPTSLEIRFDQDTVNKYIHIFKSAKKISSEIARR